MHGDTASIPLYLVWPTAGKRRCLTESVTGFAENAAKYGHKPRFVIMTDRDADIFAPGIVTDLREFEKRRGFSFLVVDKAPRENLMQRLEENFSRDILEYALTPHSDGIGWGNQRERGHARERRGLSSLHG